MSYPIELTLCLESESGVARLTRDMSQSLSRAGISTFVVDNDTSKTSRGSSIAIGQIIVDLATSGTAVALIECMKFWFMREKKLRIVYKKPNGESIVIDSMNIDEEDISNVIKDAKNA